MFLEVGERLLNVYAKALQKLLSARSIVLAAPD